MDYTKEELEAIQLSDEMMEMYKQSEERQKQREYNRKQEIKRRNIKKRKFKNAIVTAAVVTTLLGGTLSFATDMWHNNEEKAVVILNNEIGTHGGAFNPESGKYAYDLNKHLEEGNCDLTGEGSMQDRIDAYCERNNLSDHIADLAKAKYSLTYDNHHEMANNIDLLEEYRQEQKEIELQEKENDLGM